MAEIPEGIPAPLQCSGVIAPQIDEARARELAREWLESDTNPFIPEDKIRFGKAVMLYYPFWRYVREDGCTDVTVYRPACGTLLSGLQNMHRDDNEIVPIPDEANILPATIQSFVYYPELHGIARSEDLIGIPLWLISYKVKKSIYMVEVDAASGKIYEEWHPIKEPVNWRKTALIASIPLMILSLIAVYFSPWLFLLVAAVLIFFLYQSEMLGMINLKRREGKDGA
ncbi:hypothetical protein Mlab_0024 [Methanocorpusculum labreanum Z]|uniref:Uncharacterized protein n=1 Tax=Methanocorpusculum labreanum (strain ATCC 43576 / DSM 4855 / Z) TaxID=410358 RepID=A2SPE6_METLZ|nr:hypothetical protein [Methanocorpusculum labreanum]ABN06202.1 hypothetical protein Mlab_0024 [Methanocorpusculum labreanum Z]